jgi:hypothetical protein
MIDVTLAAYYEGASKAMLSPAIGRQMQQVDVDALAAQMAEQGDEALWTHFGVMAENSPENCPAVLALIRAMNALPGDSGIRMRALQAQSAAAL